MSWDPARSTSDRARVRGSTSPLAGPRPAPRLARLYQLAVVTPAIGWLTVTAILDPNAFLHPTGGTTPAILVFWAASIALIDLLPVPASGNLQFSLSFPLQLAVALLYSPGIAAAVTLVGSSDNRELKGELPPLQALFIRSQVAVSVGAESFVFHSLGDLHSPWYRIGVAVVLGVVVGYATNALLVAWYTRLRAGVRTVATLRQMHVGVLGEFLVSYMGLALFGLIIATSFDRQGLFAVGVFVAPLIFARRMFFRTRSIELATEELKRWQADNEYQAMHDSLTGLPNRVLFHKRLEEALRSGSGESRVAVMIMDLDHFKEINDTLGHHHGDLLLREIGPRVGGSLRDGDTIARLGGDEFGLLLPDVGGTQTAVAVARRVLRSLEHPFVLEGLALDVAGSIGIACSPQHGEGAETLMQRADVAMYAAKESRAGHELYAPERDRYNPERLELLGQLRSAIEDQLVLHYQPKAALPGGQVRGVEALVRWQHPQRGLIFPDQFIPLAERTAFLTPLTLRVLEMALGQCRAWRDQGLELRVSVNLSPRNLVDLHLPDEIESMLVRYEVPSSSLVLELTENTLMTDPKRAIDVLARLSAIGVGLSIDDFGTGQSSLGYLKRLPVEELKIDKSFVINMNVDDNDAIIVRSTIELSHNLGLRVVAEGVESEESWDQLAALGCDIAQGYYLARPMPAEELTIWMQERLAIAEQASEVEQPPEVTMSPNGHSPDGAEWLLPGSLPPVRRIVVG